MSTRDSLAGLSRLSKLRDSLNSFVNIESRNPAEKDNSTDLNDIPSLKAELTRVKQEMEILKVRFLQSGKGHDQAEVGQLLRIEDLEQNLMTCNHTIATQKQVISGLREELGEQQQAASTAKDELERQIADAKSSAEMSGVERAMLGSLKSQLRQKLGETETLRSKNIELEATVKAMTLLAEEQDEKLQSTRRLQSELKTYIKTKDTEANQRTQHLDDLKAQVEESQKQATASALLLRKTKRRLASAEMELKSRDASLKETKDQHSRTLKVCEDLKKRVANSVQQLRSTETDFKERLVRANSSRSSLEDRLSRTNKKLQLRLESLRQMQDKFTKSEETRRRLKKLAREQRDHIATMETTVADSKKAMAALEQTNSETEERLARCLQMHQKETQEMMQRQKQEQDEEARLAQWQLYSARLQAPPFSVSSPIIQQLLESWTTDERRLRGMNVWLQDVTRTAKRADKKFVKKVEFNRLAPETAKGFMRLVVPALEGAMEDGGRLYVYTRQKKEVRIDVRISVEASAPESWSR